MTIVTRGKPRPRGRRRPCARGQPAPHAPPRAADAGTRRARRAQSRRLHRESNAQVDAGIRRGGEGARRREAGCVSCRGCAAEGRSIEWPSGRRAYEARGAQVRRYPGAFATSVEAALACARCLGRGARALPPMPCAGLKKPSASHQAMRCVWRRRRSCSCCRCPGKKGGVAGWAVEWPLRCATVPGGEARDDLHRCNPRPAQALSVGLALPIAHGMSSHVTSPRPPFLRWLRLLSKQWST